MDSGLITPQSPGTIMIRMLPISFMTQGKSGYQHGVKVISVHWLLIGLKYGRWRRICVLIRNKVYLNYVSMKLQSFL